MRATVIGAAVMMMYTVAMPALADGSGRSNLTKLLEADLSRWPAHTGLYVKHLGHVVAALLGRDGTGDTGSVTNDVGIIYTLSGPIVIASYNMDVKGQRTEVDDRIGALARRVVDYFDGGRRQTH